MTKPKKKLSPRARKKELTGVNLAALHKRIKKLEDKLVSLEAYVKHLLKHTYC